MTTLDIRLPNTDSIRTFVNLAKQYSFPIPLRQGSVVVNAKSILGVYSLDLRELVHIDLNDDDARELSARLKPYCA